MNDNKFSKKDYFLFANLLIALSLTIPLKYIGFFDFYARRKSFGLAQ